MFILTYFRYKEIIADNIYMFYIVYVVEYPAAANWYLLVPTPVVFVATTPVLLTKFVKDEYTHEVGTP
jgi:hypothetical protein